MDKLLEERLFKISDQIEVLKKVELLFFHFSAHEKVLFASLFSKAKGKSIEDRKSEVYKNDEWIDFSKALSVSNADYLEERRKYELKLKAFDAAYLTYKIENMAIKRGVE